MKNKFLILILFLAGSFQASAQGIDFKHISFQEALKLAKEENKLVFIDFHTEWCVPCKHLANGPFKDERVGNFYNKQFINIKLDAEKEGKEAAQKYKVSRYPTLIYATPDGNLTYVVNGLKNEETLIEAGKEALKASVDEYNMETLASMYPNKKDDEDFLLLYIDKTIEFGAKPTNAIEQWLTIQNSVDESSLEMYKFLSKYASCIHYGKKAGEIMATNENTYRSLLPENDRSVNALQMSMLRNTEKAAYANNDAALLRTYIDQTKLLQAKGARTTIKDYNRIELDYLLLAHKTDEYKKKAKTYADSIINEKSIKEIRAFDQKLATNVFKDKDLDKLSNSEENRYQLYSEGLSANRTVQTIVDLGEGYLTQCETKADYKQLNSWINYCYKLIPGKYSVDILKADMLFKQGDKQKAIELKKNALTKMTNNKQKVKLQGKILEMEATL